MFHINAATEWPCDLRLTLWPGFHGNPQLFQRPVKHGNISCVCEQNITDLYQYVKCFCWWTEARGVAEALWAGPRCLIDMSQLCKVCKPHAVVQRSKPLQESAYGSRGFDGERVDNLLISHNALLLNPRLYYEPWFTVSSVIFTEHGRYTHTHTHTLTHTHKHTHKHSLSHTHTLSLSLTHTHTHTHTHTSHTHTHTHTHTTSHTHSHTLTHTHTHACRYTHTHTHSLTHTITLTHTHTLAHKHTHTYTSLEAMHKYTTLHQLSVHQILQTTASVYECCHLQLCVKVWSNCFVFVY